jgi:hypothetical protein
LSEQEKNVIALDPTCCSTQRALYPILI